MEAIVGRDVELETIERWLDTASPATLLIEGDAGIGKTTLWRAGLDAARRRGHRVLVASAAGSEAQLSFTALRDLLEASYDDIADELPSPQRHALAVMLLREEPEPSGPPPEQGVIAVSFLTAVRRIAALAPTILAIDDIQWLDPASVAPLRYAIRRVETDPLRFLLARRTAADAGGTNGVLDGIEAERISTLHIGPLSIGALGRILRAQLETTYPRPTLHRIHEVSGGNAFYALEVARALGDRTTPGETRRLPVPESLHALVDERLNALPPDTLEVLVVAAALSRPTLDQIAATLDADAELAIGAAREAGIVEIDGGAVRFEHPLFSAAVYERASEARRAELHRRLAEVVRDAEERGRHLALGAGEADEAVASGVEDAARLAAARGAFAAAAELFEEAHRLTPTGNLERRSSRALESGWHRFTAGDAGRARALLERAKESAPVGNLRAEALIRLAWLEHHSGDRRAALLSLREIELDEALHDSLRADVHLLIALSHYIMRDDLEAAFRHAREAVEISERLDDAGLLVSSLSAQGLCEFIMGGGVPNAALERALSIPPEPQDGRLLRQPLLHQASVLFYADRFDEARALLENVRELAGAHGDESVLPWPLSRLAHLELLTGNWKLAAQYADAGYDLAVQTGQRPLEADLLAMRGLVLTHMGRIDEARTTTEDALHRAECSGAGIGTRLAQSALGLLDLGVGDADAAAARLHTLKVASDSAAVFDPGENRYLGDLGEALIRVGRVSEAAELADESEARAASLQRSSARALAERVRALAALEQDDVDRAFAAFDRALDHHRRAPVPFEEARTLLALGGAQRRTRRRKAARETLERSLAGFEALGAELWAAAARSQLGRIGGRAPSSGGLTPTEQRVAELVGEGKSNKEVAAVLVVSVHTVEAALTSIYRKLGVHSRTEMARKLGSGVSKH